MLGIVVQSQPPSPPVGARLTKGLVKDTPGFGTLARRSQSFLGWEGVLCVNQFEPQWARARNSGSVLHATQATGALFAKWKIIFLPTFKSIRLQN